MKRTGTRARAFLLGSSLVTILFSADAEGKTVNVVSGPFWTVTDPQGVFLGNAQNYCLNSTAPPTCPPAATLYGYPGAAWTANLSTVGGATWIWAPNVTGATTGAGSAEFSFKMQFFLCGAPQGGTVSVAADNFAEVFINGASTPTVTSTGWSALTSANIPASSLRQGPNDIVVHAKNAPGCASDQYQCNPAGVVLGASVSDALTTWPTCTNPSGQVGDIQQLACPPGQTGSPFQVCACFGNSAFWFGPLGSCVTPPPTCTGGNGTKFSVGQTETLPCPPGRTGSASHTCQASGWGPTDASKCVPPANTCTGANGAVFAVGQTETLPCPAGESGATMPSRTCQPDGSWGPTSPGDCQLPLTCAGCPCGARDGTPPETARCPSGTTCQAKRTRVCDGWWIFRHCDYIQTTDWFCL